MLDAFNNGLRFMVLGLFVLTVLAVSVGLVLYKGRVSELAKDIRFPSLAFSLTLFMGGLFVGQITAYNDVLESCRIIGAVRMGQQPVDCRVK